MSRPRLEGRENYTHFGLYAPKEFLKRLDTAKGPYYSRNKYIIKVMEEHLKNENELKNLQGPRISSPPAQAEATTTTTQDASPTTTTSRLMTSTGSSSRRSRGEMCRR